MVCGLVKMIQPLFNRMEQFSNTSHECTSRRKRVLNTGAMCEFADQTDEGTFSVYFD